MPRSTVNADETPRSLRWAHGRGWTQVDLARRSGVPVRIVAAWEAGDLKRVDRARQIGAALDRTAGQVIDIADRWAASKRTANLGGWGRHGNRKRKA